MEFSLTGKPCIPLSDRLEDSLIFDFERFTLNCKLAYRRCGGSHYSFEEVLQVFQYYFDTYELVFDEAHPMISIAQIARIIETMPFVDDTRSGNSGGVMEIDPEDYKPMIDQHFVTKYRSCDYNINHFFSGVIRTLRYYETLY